MREFKTGSERKPVEIEVVPSEDFIREIAPHKAVHFMSRTGIAQPVQKLPRYLARQLEGTRRENDPAAHRQIMRELNKGETATSRFVLALHTAFAEHIPFTLSPEVIMGIISQEVAQFVKNNSDDLSIASLFTKTPGEKQKLVVEVNDFAYGSSSNDWLRGISKFRNMLAERVPSDVLSYMTPKFSQGTLETEVAHLVSFMDAASKYYDYGMSTMCGIPEFRIEGTADDWNTILGSVKKLKEVLPGLGVYFNHLSNVLVEIVNTVDGNKINLDFWKSIYKVDDGSGGPYSNGWFNHFYAHIYSQDWKTRQAQTILKDNDKQFSISRGFGGFKLNQFPSNLSVVEFEWDYYGQLIPMSFVGGVTSVGYEDGFLKPSLGVSVLERNPE